MNLIPLEENYESYHGHHKNGDESKFQTAGETPVGPAYRLVTDVKQFRNSTLQHGVRLVADHKLMLCFLTYCTLCIWALQSERGQDYHNYVGIKCQKNNLNP